ncbi:hypothetical protein GGR57DRAFT_504309 [Xylariaceae sp. FL1272]|nr:hypothetical protein GGR57DRAFT_504309 [Xylariaceae sp. FL1272]
MTALAVANTLAQMAAAAANEAGAENTIKDGKQDSDAEVVPQREDDIHLYEDDKFDDGITITEYNLISCVPSRSPLQLTGHDLQTWSGLLAFRSSNPLTKGSKKGVIMKRKSKREETESDDRSGKSADHQYVLQPEKSK